MDFTYAPTCSGASFPLTAAEGFVPGLGAKLFTIAGPVIVYGTVASVLYAVKHGGDNALAGSSLGNLVRSLSRNIRLQGLVVHQNISHIQPEDGVFDDEQIEHYRKVIRCCRENGIEPIVTLFHFSSPVWIIRKGGWEAETVVEDFEKYVTYVIKALGSKLKYVCTINEANMGLQVAAISRRYTMMAKKAAEAAAKNGGGEVQMGLNIKFQYQTIC